MVGGGEVEGGVSGVTAAEMWGAGTRGQNLQVTRGSPCGGQPDMFLSGAILGLRLITEACHLLHIFIEM